MADNAQSGSQRAVLNVGGNNRDIAIPNRYAGWTHHLLDIDPKGQPDICCDARALKQNVKAGIYDAVYCSHNLEHYYAHDVPKVLAGFCHVLKADGFVEIRVPDIITVMEVAVTKGLALTDVLYQSPAGPIMVRDVLYGYGREIEQSGQDFYAHKTGFCQQSLTKVMVQAGFASVGMQRTNLEIRAFGFKKKPSATRLAELEIASGPAR